MGLRVFIAQIVHELANSLNGVDTGLQLLERRISNEGGSGDDFTVAMVRELRREVERHRTLLDELRSFSRPGQFTFHSVNLAKTIEGVLRSDGVRFEQQGITVVGEVEADLPLVMGNADKLGQVIRNICNNAVEAMPEGGTLTIRGCRMFGSLVLEIRDTGIGIPQGIDVFAEFTSTKARGMGLGLSIVKEIVAAHGGEISYTSEDGKGTLFRLTLPGTFSPSVEGKNKQPARARDEAKTDHS